EDLGDVAAVQLVNDQDVGSGGVLLRRVGEATQRSGPEDKRARLGWPEPFDEVLVRVGRVELDELHGVAISEVVGELDGHIRLPCTGWSVEDDLPFVIQEVDDLAKEGPTEEKLVAELVQCDGIGGDLAPNEPKELGHSSGVVVEVGLEGVTRGVVGIDRVLD